MTSPVDVDRPEPVSAIAWPGLAEASPATVGVPLAATDGWPLSDRSVIAEIVVVNGVLVPPPVVTVIGPNEAALSGTVRLTVSFATEV